MTPAELNQLIEQNMENALVTASGEGGKFEVEVISAAFADLNTIKRHQMIYKITNPFISSGEIHALTIKAYTPEEKP